MNLVVLEKPIGERIAGVQPGAIWWMTKRLNMMATIVEYGRMTFQL